MTPRVAPVLIVSGLLLAAGAGQWLLRGATGGAGAAGGGASVNAEKTAASVVSSIVSVAQLAPVPASRAAEHHPRVATGLIDYHGNETTIVCATCHATREPDRSNGAGRKTPQAFHQGLVYAHGGQSCLSCHNADDYDSLRLADGRKLAFADSQQLCAQCHGPQTRDYQHGSHGGMRGYWDKTQGDRTRNTCLDCHDPHAPAYPAWTPVFPPRDAAARQQAEREARASHATDSDHAADHHE
jgi:hypothetical protein